MSWGVARSQSPGRLARGRRQRRSQMNVHHPKGNRIRLTAPLSRTTFYSGINPSAEVPSPSRNYVEMPSSIALLAIASASTFSERGT